MSESTLFWLVVVGVVFLWLKNRKKDSVDFVDGTVPKGQVDSDAVTSLVERTPRTMEQVTADVKQALMSRTAL